MLTEDCDIDLQQQKFVVIIWPNHLKEKKLTESHLLLDFSKI